MSTTTTNPKTLPNWATIATVAAYHGVTSRTVRNWISRGFFPAYRIPGTRGVRLNLNEVNHAMRLIPATRAHTGTASFGPNAKIIDLPYQAEAVLEGEDQ